MFPNALALMAREGIDVETPPDDRNDHYAMFVMMAFCFQDVGTRNIDEVEEAVPAAHRIRDDQGKFARVGQGIARLLFLNGGPVSTETCVHS